MKHKDREEKYLTREKLKQKSEKKQGWYFIAYINELPLKRPYGFTLFDQPFALLGNDNDLICYCLASKSIKQNGIIEIQSFKVEKRQNEIWFWLE